MAAGCRQGDRPQYGRGEIDVGDDRRHDRHPDDRDGCLITGGREGYFDALNATDGTLLWKAPLGGMIANGPIAYAIDGKQYVAVTVGNSLFVFGLRD